jgi:hypothetical protein
VYTYHLFLIHSSIVGHLLTIVNSAVIKIGVQTSVQHAGFTSFGYMPSGGIIE